MAHLFLSLFLYHYSPRSCTSATYACDCSCHLLDCKQGIAVVAGLPKRWSAEFQWFQWQLEEIGKEIQIKPSRRSPWYNQPQPSQQDLCLTPSCSDNSTTACGNTSLCWTIHSTGKFFLMFYLHLSCWSWSPWLTLPAEGTRTHCAPPLCSSLACIWQLVLSQLGPLFRPHASLSQPFLKRRFSTPSIILFAPLWAFPNWVICIPRCGNCSWAKSLPLPSWTERLSCAFCSMCLWTGIPEDWWIFAALDFCCTPKHHSPGSFFPHGSSLANCSLFCIWEIDFTSSARECNILITSVDKACCSHSDQDLRDK